MGERSFETRLGDQPAARIPQGPVVDPSSDDLDRLFAQAAERFVDSARVATAVVWVRGSDGEPRVVRGAGRRALPGPPAPAHFPALAALPGAVDLGRPDASEAERAAVERGFSAAAPVGRSGDRALAVFLVGGPADPPGEVRPRTLAALDATARRLEGPLAAAGALARLSQLDAQVRRLDRLAALGDLLAEIAHEVRNPLVSVKTFLQLLPDRLDDPEFRTRFLAVVSEEVRRIERLLDVLIEHARPAAAPGPGTSAPVARVLESVGQLVTHRALERGIELEVRADESVGGVMITPDGLRQVVLNLVLNALQVTPSGGRVCLRAARAAASVEITVEDEGPGVPAGHRPRLFEPFFSTKANQPGGLGLAISRRLVEEAGGSIALADRPGGGASFRIRLPRAS